MKTIKEHFNEEAIKHDNNFIIIMTMAEFYDEIENQINNCISKKDILVLGCGTGLEIERIKFACNVTAIDISPVMIEQLMKKEYYYEVNLQTVCASILDYNFGQEKYDIVLTCYTLHHFNVDQNVNILTNIYNSLKSNGIFINGDTTAKNADEESNQMNEARKIYGHYNLPFASLHVDVPFTKEKETSLLKEAGFSDVLIEKEWSKTTLYRCTK